MPIIRGYDTLLKEADEYFEKLNDEWERVQHKKRRVKKEDVKELLKKRMDLILKVIKKVRTCRGQLVRLHEVYGNSLEQQWGKGQMERLLSQMDNLMEKFSKFRFFLLGFPPSEPHPHLSKVNDPHRIL